MLDKRYDPKAVENGKYDFWKKKGYFEAGDLNKPPFSMVIPPPNVTGKLHLGHALDTTPQDVAARYKKLKGFDVLWLPGVDHAGIATQAKVEEALRKEGISRYDLGREKFLERVWAWKNDYTDNIHKQWASLGIMLDYSRERFTFDEGLQVSVKRVFKHLYDKGLIYRGERIINYDTKLKTALSNIEVIYEDIPGKFYYFRYPVVGDESKYVIVATTRPETMFGDVAVFVNPKDKRYKDLVGKKLINPANGDYLPVIADSYVDIKFGTGVMKCTPAHDPNDFKLSEKYHLDRIKCLDENARMLPSAGKYEGMDRYECRDAIVEKIKEDGNLEKIESITHSVGFSERSHTIVEPLLSKQWFVKMTPLAKQAIEKSSVEFLPKRFQKVFIQWMSHCEDWCISRQLWWGHRIPAYYNKKTGEVIVSETEINDPNYVQDEDVLDTWFSSALWPFATLGWPNETSDLKRYFPLSLMSTGYDIIFFWVSRMIFQSLEFTKESPFKICLIHGLIRDEQGRKMSKSLGNGVDPIEIINKYGADALRYFLTTCCTPGQDTRYSEAKIASSANYLNKIWNSARYVLLSLGDDFKSINYNFKELKPVEQDILVKLNHAIKKVTSYMDKYEFSLACQTLHDFVYDDFCSNYLEMSKVSLKNADEHYQKVIGSILIEILHSIIVMLHPFAPFITEEIYLSLPEHLESIMLEKYPEVKKLSKVDLTQVDELYKMIVDIRAFKIEHKLAPNYALNVIISTKEKLFEDFVTYLQRFSFAKNIQIVEEDSKGICYIYKNLKMYLSEDISDEELLLKKQKDIAYLESEIKRCEGLLNNPHFVEKAPKEKVELEKNKLSEFKRKLNDLK